MSIYFPSTVAKAKQPHLICKTNDNIFVILTLKQHNDKILQLLHRNKEINTSIVCVSKLSKSYLPKILETVFLVYLINGDFH